MVYINKGGKLLEKLWCCLCGKYYKIIWFYQLGLIMWIDHRKEILKLTFRALALPSVEGPSNAQSNLFTVANSHSQPSYKNQIISVYVISQVSKKTTVSYRLWLIPFSWQCLFKQGYQNKGSENGFIQDRTITTTHVIPTESLHIVYSFCLVQYSSICSSLQ